MTMIMVALACAGLASAAPEDRILRAVMTLDAPAADVWALWTTETGLVSFLAPAAHVEPRVDGRYDIFFNPEARDGERGADGMRILVYEPERRLSFTWNAPVSQPYARAQRTVVTIVLDPLPAGGTRLTFTHAGWGEGPDWDRAYDYFDTAWNAVVLPRLRHRVASGPVDLASPPALEPIASTLKMQLARAPSDATAQEPPATTARFELRSQPRVSLHHFLLAWALAEKGEWPPFAPRITERDSWRDRLDDDEAAVWSAAVDAYAAARRRSLLFDQGMLAVRAWAAGAGARDAIPEPDRALAGALESALPVYLRHWWPDHDRGNRSWVETLAPDLAAFEEAVIRRLETAYGGVWPARRVPIDVVPYANPVGAYSTGGRVTIASRDPDIRMPQALELVFHEASHLDQLEAPLRSAIGDAFGAEGAAEPDPLWHDLIFFTAGEALRLVMAERGEPGYRHYGDLTGVYTRGERWTRELPAFRRHWLPFLAEASGDANARRRALRAIARELAGRVP